MVGKVYRTTDDRLGGRARGFTIIELIVVVVVIGILVGITSVAYGGVNLRAKDTRRLSDTHTITTALELYKINNNSYPSPTSVNGSWEDSNEDGGEGAFMEYLQSSGVTSRPIPVDPVNTASQSYAYYKYPAGSYSCDVSRGDYYVLGVRDMESSGRPHPKSPGFSCSGRNWGGEFDWVTGAYEN